jgi:hypothetical protein
MSESLQWLFDFNSSELPTESTNVEQDAADSRSANPENAELNNVIMVIKYYEIIYISFLSCYLTYYLLSF